MTGENPLKAARAAALANEDLDALVTGIYVGLWAPDAAVRPYVTLNFTARSTTVRWMRQGSLIADIWTDGPNNTKARQIRDALTESLDLQVLDDGVNAFRLGEATNDGPAPTEDSKVAHWHIEFPVRFWRQSLVLARGL